MKQHTRNDMKRVNVSVNLELLLDVNDQCRCECREFVDKGVRDKGFIWNPSNCECECDKACDVGEYLYYENCKCRKKN